MQGEQYIQIVSGLIQKAWDTQKDKLEEAAKKIAEAIGANPILARVGTMYHDIGKLLRPMFFCREPIFLWY